MAARDVIMYAVILFTFAILIFVAFYMTDTVVTQMTDAPQINGTRAEATFDTLPVTLAKFDKAMFMLFMGLILALIVTSWFVGGYPIFMFIYFIFIVIGVVLSAILSNVWESIVTRQVFFTANTIATFPITDNIMTFLPYYIAVAGFVGMIIMFAKPSQ